MLASGTRACAPAALARGPLAPIRVLPRRAQVSRGGARRRPRVQQRPLPVRRAAPARIPTSAVATLLARARRPTEGTARGASSVPWAEPVPGAPRAIRVLPEGQPRLAAKAPLEAKPPSVEPARWSQGHDRACDLGRPAARSEACGQNRPPVPNGAGRRTLGQPRAPGLPPVLCWSRAPRHDRRPVREPGWLAGTGQLRGTGRPQGTGQPQGTGSAQGAGAAAAAG
jgi:hypothetical protein